MVESPATDSNTLAFIARWKGIAASELATAQSFVAELCELLGVARPHPTPELDYMFERPVTFTHGNGSRSAGRIDCYRRGHFCTGSQKAQGRRPHQGLRRRPAARPRPGRRLCPCLAGIRGPAALSAGSGCRQRH